MSVVDSATSTSLLHASWSCGLSATCLVSRSYSLGGVCGCSDWGCSRTSGVVSSAPSGFTGSVVDIVNVMVFNDAPRGKVMALERTLNNGIYALKTKFEMNVVSKEYPGTSK